MRMPREKKRKRERNRLRKAAVRAERRQGSENWEVSDGLTVETMGKKRAKTQGNSLGAATREIVQNRC